MKTKESLTLAVITTALLTIFYVTVPSNPKNFKLPEPQNEHRKVHDRLDK